MGNNPKLVRDHAIFSTRKIDSIIILYLKDVFLIRLDDLDAKAELLRYLDILSEDNSIKVLVIMSSPHERDSNEYIKFYQRALEWRLLPDSIYRMHNAVDQYIMSISQLNKFVIYVDRRSSIPFFLNLSFACDYRIIMEGSFFNNFHQDLGLAPKGGCIFFLERMIGITKTFEILFADRKIEAQEALRLGVVNKIAKADELENAAMNTARHFEGIETPYLSGTKKLLNYSLMNLEKYLEFENEELYRNISLVVSGKD